MKNKFQAASGAIIFLFAFKFEVDIYYYLFGPTWYSVGILIALIIATPFFIWWGIRIINNMATLK